MNIRWKYKDHKITENLIYVADFETTTNNCEWFKQRKKIDPNFFDSRITYWYARPLEDKHLDKHPPCEGSNGVSFLKWLKSIKTNATIYFHNLTFDGRIVISLLLQYHKLFIKAKNQFKPVQYNLDENGVLIEEGFNYKLIDKKSNYYQKEIKPYYFQEFKNGNKLFSIKTCLSNNQKNLINITFLCSQKILLSSVEQIGKAFANETFENKPLMKMFENEKAMGQAFYDVEPNDNLEQFKKDNPDYCAYCRRDVEIVRRALLQFNETLSQLPTIKNYLDNRKNKKEKQNKQCRSIYNGLRQGLTIAGIGRHILGSMYVSLFQDGWVVDKQTYKKKRVDLGYEIDQTTNYKHTNREYGSFILLDYETHQFFKEPHYYDDECEDNKVGGSCFYTGGFTQFNKQFQDKELIPISDGIKIDIKSAYPYQMFYDAPFGKIMDIDEFELEGKPKNHIEWLKIYVDKATPKEIAKYCPTLPNMYKNDKDSNEYKHRYVAETQERFCLCVCRQLWEELQNWYDFELDESRGIEGIEHYYQLAAPYLRNVALEIYDAKEYKFGVKDKNDNKLYPAQQLMTKILINSIYGSLAISPHFDSLMWCNNDSYIQIKDNHSKDEKEYQIIKNKESKTSYGNISGFSPSNEIGNGLNVDQYKCFKIDEEWDPNKKQIFNISASAYITQLERVYLFKTIREIGAQYFAYSDTDSIIFCNFPKEVREKILKLCEIKPLEQYGTNLGQWEIENLNLKSFKADKAKQYFYEDDKGKFYFKTAGGKLNVDSKDYYVITHMSECLDWTFEQYKDFYKETNIEVSIEDFEHFKKGSLVLQEGDKRMVSTPNGWLLQTKKKIIKQNTQ